MLAQGVVHLDPATAVFEGMLEGWARLPSHHRYQLTPLGRRVAVLFTKVYGRVLAPGLAELEPKAPNRSRPSQRPGPRLVPTRPTPESIHRRSTYRSLNPSLV